LADMKSCPVIMTRFEEDEKYFKNDFKTDN